MAVIVQVILGFLSVISSEWIELVLAPFKKPDILWILIPIYINWIFTERYQELKETSYGNAISNGAVVLWVGIDWIRTLIRLLSLSRNGLSLDIIIKFSFALVAIIYGLTIIISGIKAKKFVKYFGRIREISYVMILFSPIIYGVVNIGFNSIVAILFYFPIFYFFIEFLNNILPKPKTYDAETGSSSALKNKFDSKLSSNSSPFSSDKSSTDLFSQNNPLSSSNPFGTNNNSLNNTNNINNNSIPSFDSNNNNSLNTFSDNPFSNPSLNSQQDNSLNNQNNNNFSQADYSQQNVQFSQPQQTNQFNSENFNQQVQNNDSGFNNLEDYSKNSDKLKSKFSDMPGFNDIKHEY